MNLAKSFGLFGRRAARLAATRVQSSGFSTSTVRQVSVSTEPGTSTFSALESRLNLKFKDTELMEQVCTHRSYEQGRVATNERLVWIGKRVLNLHVGEHLQKTYPNLPPEMLQDVQHANFGLSGLAEVAKHFGMQPAMRWKPVVKEAPQVGLTKVLGKSVQALVGAIYQDLGDAAARAFVAQHIVQSRPVDVENVMLIKNPKLMLRALCKRKNLPYPVARILKETGRFTSSPVFIVGIFTGTRMIGMGYGSSIKMAEFRAAKDALLKHYAKEIKDIEINEEESDADFTFVPQSGADAKADDNAQQ
ncbi:54S ribosomal protein L3 mitochondrial [Coemansia sp. RSA 1813]|nr:54S ribosomal protein L3 mitochondrial [Coemansia sp. RSA 1646]KAJ1769384.1 54S ribosomal protein L3 mitochondrial [Coemansia sp. RSA 1843]KAJ2090750.1 54S ribosomal protein L3 mitochondrial [Coemansia sp. RSA 986]KAJ2216000.1 54S ribosomal protein L3 mitochondrial [Coemansia sp. RSA 487]KAJ2570412.1 54S ribosomal protein L3 mitochondrial [Coemansia sp. RSA 1813]